MCRRPMKRRCQVILAQRHRSEARDWLPVHEAAHTTFPPIDDIMRHRTVPGRLAWRIKA